MLLETMDALELHIHETRNAHARLIFKEVVSHFSSIRREREEIVANM